MKALLFACYMLLATAGQAQTAPAASETTRPLYCLLLVGTSFTSGRFSLSLDYGQDQRAVPAVQDAQLAQLAKQVERYTSIPAALSYLATQGWEYVAATTLTVPHETSSNYQGGQVGYLLRRRP